MSHPQSRPTELFLGPADSRSGEPLNIVGSLMYIKLSGKDTGGAFSLMHNVIPPGSGSPVHVHHREDESFYVLEGDFAFELDGRRIEAHAGDFLRAPRDVPHIFQNIGSTTGKLILIAEPAGLEDFFVELSAAGAGAPDLGSLRVLFEKYGLELLGPPKSLK